MKANELRIGNIISKRGAVITVEPAMILKVSRYPLPYNPIPTTEEWLIKLGFEGDDDERHIVLGLGGGEELSIELSTKTCCLIRAIKNESVDFVYVAYPEYVHQLQNLYFALTGKELEFKSWKRCGDVSFRPLKAQQHLQG